MANWHLTDSSFFLIMNTQNRTIFEGDNLHILRGLDSETIDLIYLDPPFNSNKTYEAPIGSEAAGAAFKDAWTLDDLDNAWHGELAEREPALYAAISAAEFTHGKSMKAYLIMMGIRMLEMRRVLKSTGSIYLHCDPTASHYLKTLMDAVFGVNSFRNEVVWHYQAGTKPKTAFGRKHDTLFWYSKGRKWIHNRQGQPVQNPERYTETDDDGRKFLWGGNWDKILKRGTKKYYLDDGKACDDVWTWINESEFNSLNSQSKERTGYPTQKPLALLERIIKASSHRGDIVLDPFCGCATTCIAAEKHQRQWIGIDLSPKAVELVKRRLVRDLEIAEDQANLLGEQVIHRTDVPIREQPEAPHQIPMESLFGMRTVSELTFSQVELRQFRSHKHTLFGIQEGTCNGCEVLFPFRNMTIDHIHPRSKGGTDDPENLQLLCGACNSMKGDRSQAYLKKRLREEGILR